MKLNLDDKILNNETSIFFGYTSNNINPLIIIVSENNDLDIEKLNIGDIIEFGIQQLEVVSNNVSSFKIPDLDVIININKKVYGFEVSELD